MRQVLEKIKDIPTKYSFDHVDCFERIMAIMYMSIKPGSEKLFLAYQKVKKTLWIEDRQMENFPDYTKEIGVSCIKTHIEGNLIEELIKNIDRGYPVAVPTNQKMLYYAKQYKSEDTPHLVLIKGYDREKELFYMLDDTQQIIASDDIQYTDFVITFDMLQEVFQGYADIYESTVFHFELSEDELEPRSYLINCINDICELSAHYDYIEPTLIKLYNTGYKSRQVDTRNFINAPKFRGVAMKCLIESLESFGIACDDLRRLADSIEEHWKYYNLKIFKRTNKRNGKAVIYELPDDIRMDSKKFMEELQQKSILLSKMKNDVSLQETYKCENNEDNIIRIKDNQYTFCFNTGKIYNSWFGDCCPKVVVCEDKSKLQSFCFQTAFEKQIDNHQEGHQAGIYIRTKYHLYSFGVDHRDIFHFDDVGRDTIDVSDHQPEGNSYSLYVRLNNNRISYGTQKKDLNVVYGEREFTDEVIEVGVFSKTWSECNIFQVVFNKIDLELDNK